MFEQFSFEDHAELIELRRIWEETLAALEDQVPETARERFLKPLRPAGMEGDSAQFIAPGQFVLEWVKDKYIDTLQDEISKQRGRRTKVELKLEQSEKTEPASNLASVVSTSNGPDLSAFRANNKYSFDNFVQGLSNRLAYAGCRAVADAPGTKYNPLFIYGPSGLGKTHLLNAIANEILRRDPRFPVAYLTAQRFAEEFVYALQNNRIEQFRRAQRSVSVWLLDDVQFIAGKDRTQEELFHTFNYLQGLGKQIVLCSDRPPRDLLLMDERLRSRFEAGLVADVQMPDTETRCAILLKKAEIEGIPLDLDVAMTLAEGITGNVRLLEGALTKLSAQASMENLPLTRDLAQEVLERHYKHVGAVKPNFDQILTAVARTTRIEKEEIRGLSRKAPIAHARHMAVYVTREITGDSWKHIGALFGNRDHTSMMHGYKKIRDMMNRDKELSASVKALIRDLYPDSA